MFLSCAYVLICVFASFLQEVYGNYSIAVIAGPDWISAVITKTMGFLLIPLGDFSVTGKLASGELIELSYMGKLIIFSVVLRTLPLFILGAYLYRRRELGLAMKQ